MDSFESLASLGDQMSEMPGYQGLPETESYRHVRERQKTEQAIRDHEGDEAAQIEEIAKRRGYFRGTGPAVGIVDSYIRGDIDVHEAVRQIAEPIEYAYVTADGGRRFVHAEQVARRQRPYWSAEEAAERWGLEDDLDELQKRVSDSDDAPTVEGQLWDLYYTILHASKKMPWRDEAAQQKLLDLMAALKARPDPPFPANMSIPLKRSWIYTWSGLWSDMCMFGPSARETWNDCPGAGAGWYPPEISAWTNVNAFVARLTAQKIFDLAMYGTWALHQALEEKIYTNPYPHNLDHSKAYKAELLFEVAAVWIRLAGQSILDYTTREPDEEEKTQSKRPTDPKWPKWQKRFEEEAAKDQYSPKVTAVAKECAEIMSRISAQAEELQKQTIK